MEGGRFPVTNTSILTAIEELRQGMYCIARIKGSVGDQEVLSASQKLDSALNNYYRAKYSNLQGGASY
jgi:hypothetical protein